MKKALVLTIAIIGIVAFLARPSYKMNESIKGEIKSVNYYTLNVRDKPKGEVIGELQLRNQVKLTGETCSFLMCDTNSAHWTEIEYNGTQAWVVTDALR